MSGQVSCGNQAGPAAELCDSLDNDCDGQTDEDYDVTADITNCGSCGYSCPSHAGANSVATGCNGGACQFICQATFYDLNGDIALGDAGDGCEYGCSFTNGGVEACGDSVDNDCDGQTDEGFDYDNDPNNCGSCGYSCAANAPFGTTSTGCSSATCQYACQTNYYDLNSDLALGPAGNGCEYACTVSNGGNEACDNMDNDCDGLVDEDFNKQTDPDNCGSCGHVCAAHAGADSTATGCSFGTCQFTCDSGFIDLNGDVSLGDQGDGCEQPCTVTNGGVEACDTVDNDCDGQTDEGFDLMIDPDNCSACGFRCMDNYPPATYHVAFFSCQGGQCAISVCDGNYYDLDGLLEDIPNGLYGCEYNCIMQYPFEVCNGVDDDCDGVTDASPMDTPNCLDQGVCVGATADCTGGAWQCNYPVTYQSAEDDAMGCDGLDNDCDGTTDEAFSVGQSCSVGQGVCRRSGVWVCNIMGTDSECTATPGVPEVEICDGLDNDCDGQVDEVDPTDPDFNQYGEFVYVVNGNFTIFAFEASRPSADASDEGFGDDGVPCSVGGVMPWSSLTSVDTTPLGDVTVREACQRLGPAWDLCTDAEWYRVCADGVLPSGGELFPYGNTYEPLTCNGYDYGIANGGIGPRPAGTLALCERSFAGGSIYDMSGNLKEWVQAGAGFEVRGGAYNNVSDGGEAPGLQCDGVSPVSPGTEVHLPSIGFRCCYAGDLFN